MNLCLDDAEEVYMKTKTRKPLGKSLVNFLWFRTFQKLENATEHVFIKKCKYLVLRDHLKLGLPIYNLKNYFKSNLLGGKFRKKFCF